MPVKLVLEYADFFSIQCFALFPERYTRAASLCVFEIILIPPERIKIFRKLLDQIVIYVFHKQLVLVASPLFLIILPQDLGDKRHKKPGSL